MLHTESIASVGSRKSLGRYHKVSSGARVDESLFGKTASQMILSGKPVNGKTGDAGAVKHAGESIRSAAGRTAGNAASPTLPTMINEDEIYRMQQSAVVKTSEDLRAERDEKEAARKERAAVAELRKERIRSLEAQRVANLPLSQLAQEEADARKARCALAKQMRDEAQDDMKAMDSIFNFAITTAIRDRQKGDRPEREAEAKMAERLVELKAEIEALESQKRADEIEAVKKAQRAGYRDDVLAQLEAAHARKSLRAEMAREEDQVILDKIKRDELAYQAKKEKLQERKVKNLAETLSLNEAAIAYKGERLAAERALEAKAAAEAIAMDMKKAAELEEQERVRKEKDRLQSLAAGVMERMADDRDQRDELIMRRAWEEGMRNERKKEIERRRKEKEDKEQLDAARNYMMEDKQLRMATMIAAEKDEFMRGKAVQDEWLAQARIVDEERQKGNAEHLKALKKQMHERESTAKSARAKDIAAENARREEQRAHMDYLRSLRDQKVEQLKALGVDSKYVVQLMSYDPDKVTAKKEMVSAKDKK